MRIVHAIRSDGFAGVERHVASLSSAQARQGHDVAVIGGDVAAMRTAFGGARVPHRGAATVAATAAAIGSWSRCDVLHVHMTAAEVASVVAVRSWRVPVVSTRHFASRRGTGSAGSLVAGAVRRRIGAQIAISAYVADHVDGASTVVHTGVESRPDARQAAERDRTVLLAQRLEPEKRTDIGVRAFAASGLADDGWRLQLAGTGSQRARIADLVARLGLAGSVDLLGHRSDVAALMERAGILLATCPVEGLGLTVLEAMAHGLPVVAADGGGHAETLAAADGALYDPLNPDDAGRHLARMAADPAARDAYGKGLQSVQRHAFTLEAQARATEAVYRSVL